MHSKPAVGWGRVSGALTCVYPQMDFEMMGGAEGLATVGAILGGRGHTPLTMLGQRRLNAPCCLPQVLPNIWSAHRDSTRRERQMEGVLSATSNQPSTHHNTTRFFFFSFSSVCQSLSPVSLAQMCERHTKSNASNGLTGRAIFLPDRTLTVHKLFSFFRNTIVLRYTPLSQLKHTHPQHHHLHHHHRLSFLLLFFFFYPCYHHHSY